MKFDHAAICVKSISNSVEWFTSNLSAEILYCDETWAMLSVGNVKVALTLESQHPPHLGFKVDSLSDMPSGADVKKHRDGTSYVYKEDLDGNVIELIYYPEDTVD